MTYQRRDFYWKRVGLFWELWTECAGAHFALSSLRFWREGTAANVTNLIFAAYHDGRDQERAARVASHKSGET